MREYKNEKKHKWLHLRLSQAEYDKLLKGYSKTTEPYISSYTRKILLGKPMYKGTRNLSTEALIEEFSGLVKTLNGVANNFNQVTHKLHTLRSIPEFQHWALAYERDKNRLLKDIEAIREYMDKNAALWLQ